MSADRIIPMTWGSQGHEVTSNTWVYQRVKQKGGEAPTLTSPHFKDSNLGI